MSCLLRLPGPELTGIDRSWQLEVVSIYSELSKDLIRTRLEQGQIEGCGRSVPLLTTSIIDQTPRVVAQMGPEPFLSAMIRNPNYHVMVSGRAYDPAPYVAFAAYHLLEPKYRDISHLSAEALGAIYHMGKILECGGICATPKGLGAMGIVRSDLSVDIKPLDPAAKCTPLGVAAHTLYEKTRPDLLVGPGGVLDLATSKYVQLNDGITTRISGSTFHLAQREKKPYTVKLEGARVAGFRTLMMGSFSDPILISQIDSFLAAAKEYACAQMECDDGTVDIGFHVYGLDANRPETIPAQIFVVTETLAPTQALATGLASALRVHLSHGSYAGQKATSGNFGMGIGGRFELETAECAEFSVYHLMRLGEDEESAAEYHEQTKCLFKWKTVHIGEGALQYFADRDGVPIKPATKATPKTLVARQMPAARSLDTSSARTLFDIAKVIRSKNAGPFEITLDVMFDNAGLYHAVKDSGILSRHTIADLYQIPPEDVVWASFFDAALAFKATIPRQRNGKTSCSGGFMEDDVHGSQQYGLLRQIALPEELISTLQEL